MLIETLRLTDFRRFTSAAITLQPGLNFLSGDNGSGKTSVLEALHLLAHGRSFRGRVRDGLIRQGAPELQVFCAWSLPTGGHHRAGLRHTGSRWQARLDGVTLQQLGDLCEALAIVSFEPGSHALIDGSSQLRRRFLDWGVFHVEQDFILQWRRYARALKQRNVLLRQGRASQLESWEQEMASAGEALTDCRERYLQQLQRYVQRMLPELFPTAGAIQIHLEPGWRRQELSLLDALYLARDRDLSVGHTTQGPHRADMQLWLASWAGIGGLSRGQTKQLALLLLLGQAAHLSEILGHWPLVQLDDLGSELDRHHQSRVLEVLQGTGAQVLMTGTEPLPAFSRMEAPIAMFHVEHGEITATG